MNCHDARRLFGPYWDDETTQAEREWLEAHFASCGGCRSDYESMARVLELAGSLPRHETAPDLLERTLARARRASQARDTLPERRSGRVVVTAAAAAVLVLAAVVSQWSDMRRGDRVALAPKQAPVAMVTTVAPSQRAVARTPAVTDSIFDHAEDVQFVLDPVMLRRGRATVGGDLPGGIRTERAVVSF